MAGAPQGCICAADLLCASAPFGLCSQPLHPHPCPACTRITLVLLFLSSSQPGCSFGDCPFLGSLNISYALPSPHSFAPFQLIAWQFFHCHLVIFFSIWSTVVSFQRASLKCLHIVYTRNLLAVLRLEQKGLKSNQKYEFNLVIDRKIISKCNGKM